MHKNNKDYKILSSIENCFIQYLLFLFDDIKSQIDIYNDNKIVKNYKKIFQSEIFKNLSIPIKKCIKNNNISGSELNNITNNLIEKLNKIIGNIQDFNLLNQELYENISIINNGIIQNNVCFQNFYEEIIKIKPSQNEQTINLEKNQEINKLFEIFNFDLSKNNNYAKQININEDLNSLIKKIFLFGVKYYNCFEKLNLLLKNLI